MDAEDLRRREEADRRLFATVDQHRHRVAEAMKAIRAMNVTTPREDQLRKHITTMKMSLLNNEKEHKILFVTGESNAGKSRLVGNVISSDTAFAKYWDDEGVATPLLAMKAPSPFTHRNFGVKLLGGLSFPVRDGISESHVWPIVPRQLRAHRVKFVVIDEAQRAMKIKDEGELQKLTENLIEMVDSEVWPIRIILIGVSRLEMLRSRDDQMKNRSFEMSLEPIPNEKVGRIELWINEIICNHARFEMSGFDIRDFAKRLRHSTDGNAGSTIELIWSAVEQAMFDRRSTVYPIDFAQAYANRSACARQDNVFDQTLWETLPSGMAKMVDKEGEHQSDVPGLKPLKPGERPR